MTRSEWDAETVLAASNDWVWVPEGSQVVRGDGYLVVNRPAYLDLPPAVKLSGSAHEPRDPAVLVDEVTALVAGRWPTDRVAWHVSDLTRPEGLEAVLMRRGGRVDVRMDVLALPLTDGLPPVEVPTDVSVRTVVDEPTMRDAHTVSGEAFGSPAPTPEQIEAALAELETGLPEGPVGRVVAYVGGEPAGTGGWTLVGPVCRLWGGSTHTAFRGRGAYRVVLGERLRLAREAGATLALSHGVVDTSSPILRRLGFTRYGEERIVELPLG